MQTFSLDIQPLAYQRVDRPWLPDMRPYRYQNALNDAIEKAMDEEETQCLFLVTPTGSGKTLGSYAYAIQHRDDVKALGVYPTNALIHDQERALRDWLAPDDATDLIRIDSRTLDRWQRQMDLQQHALTLEILLNWNRHLLTNPDILFYLFFGLYEGQSGIKQRLLTRLARYRYFVFDEFHLYNVKQMADMAFFVSTLNAINPNRGRVFIFASATPDSPARAWLKNNLELPVRIVEGSPSQEPDARTIAQPLRLTLLPADLRHWKGEEALMAFLADLKAFMGEYPGARIVTILDSVIGALEMAQTFRDQFPDTPVGEIHGVSSTVEREDALHRPITVGTSTIEVGIDFKDEMTKDVLIFEARTAAKFIQRFGRLARHAKAEAIPNWAIALVPEYVYHYVSQELDSEEAITRLALYRKIREGYQSHEDFQRYLRKHAPVEFHHARWQVQGVLQSDDRPEITERIGQGIPALTDKTPAQAKGMYYEYKKDRHILAPLLTFRGSGFQAAFLDERGIDPGFPAKRYGLMFLLRRGEIVEIDEKTYRDALGALEARWSEETARERRYSKKIGRKPEDLLGVYGYFRLKGLVDEARRVYFEIDEDALFGEKATVTVLDGLQIHTDPPLNLRRLNRFLSRKRIVAWFTQRHPAAIKLGRALPPLFEIYELKTRSRGGKLRNQSWSIAFNQDAFFVDSLNWYVDQQEDRAIIL